MTAVMAGPTPGGPGYPVRSEAAGWNTGTAGAMEHERVVRPSPRKGSCSARRGYSIRGYRMGNMERLEDLPLVRARALRVRARCQGELLEDRMPIESRTAKPGSCIANFVCLAHK